MCVCVCVRVHAHTHVCVCVHKNFYVMSRSRAKTGCDIQEIMTAKFDRLSGRFARAAEAQLYRANQAACQLSTHELTKPTWGHMYEQQIKLKLDSP